MLCMYRREYIKLFCSTRVSNELGAGNRHGAQVTVGAVMVLVVLEATIVSVALFCCLYVLGYAYSNEPEVVDYVAKMVPLLRLSISVDISGPSLSLQGKVIGVASLSLRTSKLSITPSYLVKHYCLKLCDQIWYFELITTILFMYYHILFIGIQNILVLCIRGCKRQWMAANRGLCQSGSILSSRNSSSFPFGFYSSFKSV